MSGASVEALLSAAGVSVSEAPDEGVVELLRKGKGGAPTACPANLDLIFATDARWSGQLRFNEFDAQVYRGEKPLIDSDIASARLWLSQVYGITATEGNVESALSLVARRNPFHPLREMFRAMPWDCVRRLDGLLAFYAGAEDTPLNAALGRRFMIAAVARAMRPGCKHDSMLVLHGRQGALKSTFVSTLAMHPEFFSDTVLDLNSKDAMENILGKWMVEWQECHALLTAPPTNVKAFLSSAADHFRLPYDRRSARHLRACVFVGTTNHEQFVDDYTGSRRFWPVATGRMRIPALRRDCAQLWAEALAAFEHSEQWHLTAREAAWLDRESSRFRCDDPWGPALEEWIEARGPFTLAEAGEAVGVPLSRVDKRIQARLAACLRTLGCARAQRMIGGVKAWRWERVADGEDSDSTRPSVDRSIPEEPEEPP